MRMSDPLFPSFEAFERNELRRWESASLDDMIAELLPPRSRKAAREFLSTSAGDPARAAGAQGRA